MSFEQPLHQMGSFAFEASRKLSERCMIFCMPTPFTDTQPDFNTSETQNLHEFMEENTHHDDYLKHCVKITLPQT